MCVNCIQLFEIHVVLFWFKILPFYGRGSFCIESGRFTGDTAERAPFLVTWIPRFICGVFLKMENDIEWIKKRFGVRTSGAKSEPVIFLYVIWFNLICAVFFHILWKSSVCSGTSCSIDLILFTSCISDSVIYAEVWFSGTSLFPSTLIILSIPWIKTNFFCRIKNGFLLFLTLWDTC